MNDLKNPRFPFAHTFSIIARDPETGHLGVAVQSHWFSVGYLVTWAEAGTGAVATQSMVEINYGPLGLELMRHGRTAQDALKILLNEDEQRETRQVAMVDAFGNVAVHTGARCIEASGHETGAGFSVQANMMANATIWPAMAKAYREAKGDLAERMMQALEAGQRAGGDIRGQQSAAMLIVGSKRSKYPWNDTIMELRVEDHPEPILKLRYLLETQRAYSLMNQGDALLANGNVPEALESYKKAAEKAPHIVELPFWHAVTLAELGNLSEALPLFEKVFKEDPNWAILIQRLPAAGLLRDDPELMRQILSVQS